MKRIGLIGESPGDTICIQNLLLRYFSEHIDEVFFMIERINGSMLDSQKTKRFLRLEYELERPDFVIFIRDLDGFESDKPLVKKRREYFLEFNSVVDKKGIYLLNIHEIEALILSDIEIFNKKYKVSIPTIHNPMLIANPKKVLKGYCHLYDQSHNPDLFNLLRLDILLRCEYFRKFITKLENALHQ